MHISRYCLPFVFMVASLALPPLALSAKALLLHYVLSDSLQLKGPIHWDYLSYDPESYHLYITRGDRVQVMDINTKKIIGTLPNLEGVHGVALAYDSQKGFISEGKGNRVTVFDLKTLALPGFLG